MTVLKSKHFEYKMRQNALCAGCGDNPCIPETCSKIGHLFAKQVMEERAEFVKDLDEIWIAVKTYNRQFTDFTMKVVVEGLITDIVQKKITKYKPK